MRPFAIPKHIGNKNRKIGYESVRLLRYVPAMAIEPPIKICSLGLNPFVYMWEPTTMKTMDVVEMMGSKI